MSVRLSPEQVQRHAEMLANRVRKNLRRLRPGFQRSGIEAFRVYDWDIPEVRARVDHYAGRYVVAELQRSQTDGIGYLEALVDGLRTGLGLDEGQVVGKRRRTRPRSGEARYAKEDDRAERFAVQEGPLSFLVNLHDYLDTGLFADHRLLRQKVREEAGGKRVLNLYAYTGSFSVAALSGRAAQVTSVDLSGVYLKWAEDNLRHNRLPLHGHRGVRSDVEDYLRGEARRAAWDVIILDPPSFSTVGGGGNLDVQRDHPALVRAALEVLAPGGTLYFSTNHQRFEPRLDDVPAQVRELTDALVPAEYREAPFRAFELHHSERTMRT